VIMRQQSHTTRQHSYGTGGFCHDIVYRPLEIPTLPQRACRVQIAIHPTQCVFETLSKREPTRFGVVFAVANRVFQSISAQFILARGTAALFSRRLMVSTLNGSLPSM
jgi:hypothetical protein